MKNVFVALLTGLLLCSGPASAAEKPSFQTMDRHMQEMRAEMDKIRGTQDPKEKQALLDEHMKKMQAQMDMMGAMMKEMGKGGMAGQMGQMHGMMGQMMGQMQEHMKSCPMTPKSKAE